LAAAGALLLAFGVAACSQILPATAPPANVSTGASSAAQAPAAATADVPALVSPTRVPSGIKTVTVSRGSITETLGLDGTVVAQDQQPVSYNGSAIVSAVKVKVGDTVKQGDELLELEAPHHQSADDVQHQIQLAQAKLATDQASLAKAQAAFAMQQQQAAGNAVAAAKQRQQVIADAASNLKRAQDNLAKVQAGASSADRQTVQNGVTAAQTGLQIATAAYNVIAAGPDQNAIRTATRDATTAQAALAKAQSDFDTLTKGADPTAVRDAQAALTRAQTQLQITQASKPDPKLDPSIAKLQHDQAVQDAQVAMDNASAALGKLKLPPSDADVQAAKQRVSDASDANAAAQTKLAQVQSGPDPTALNTAQAAVDKANQDVLSAQAKLADVNSHPTPTELGDAQDQVRRAQAALDQANTSPQTAAPADNSDTFSSLQNAITDDQTTIQTLQQTLDGTQLLAPADGIVVSVRVKASQAITADKPVLVLAPQVPPIIRADLEDDQVQRLAVGQSAKVSLDPGNTAAPQLGATITRMTPASADGSVGASADLQVQWPAGGTMPKFGTAADVELTLQQKDNVLLIPLSALHQSGNKASVQVQTGTLRRLVNVEVGIKDGTNAEIVSGLTEGQAVILGTS
jgi:HlyD family secretion protein